MIPARLQTAIFQLSDPNQTRRTNTTSRSLTQASPRRAGLESRAPPRAGQTRLKGCEDRTTALPWRKTHTHTPHTSGWDTANVSHPLSGEAHPDPGCPEGSSLPPQPLGGKTRSLSLPEHTDGAAPASCGRKRGKRAETPQLPSSISTPSSLHLHRRHPPPLRRRCFSKLPQRGGHRHLLHRLSPPSVPPARFPPRPCPQGCPAGTRHVQLPAESASGHRCVHLPSAGGAPRAERRYPVVNFYTNKHQGFCPNRGPSRVSAVRADRGASEKFSLRKERTTLFHLPTTGNKRIWKKMKSRLIEGFLWFIKWEPKSSRVWSQLVIVKRMKIKPH